MIKKKAATAVGFTALRTVIFLAVCSGMSVSNACRIELSRNGFRNLYPIDKSGFKLSPGKGHLKIRLHKFLERASRSALTKYTIKSLVYVSTTNIYLEYIGYMFRPVNRSSSGHQSNKSK